MRFQLLMVGGRWGAALTAVALLCAPADPRLLAQDGGEDALRLAITTSTRDTGLMDLLAPAFEERSGIRLWIVAVGSGEALRLGRDGAVDLVLVHAPAAEQRFVAEGWGSRRHPVMYNHFVLLGPPRENAVPRGEVRPLLRALAAAGRTFVSRGDSSGTHTKEQALWRHAGIEPGGDWYLEAGQGMAATLLLADQKRAFTLCDYGTYLALRDKIDLIAYTGEEAVLHNPYHAIMVNPERHPHVRVQAAMRFIEFLTGEAGQRIIGELRADTQPLFRPLPFP